MALEDWSSTAANNGTVLGVNIAEGCPAANVNNAMRQMMADVAGGINMSVLGTFLASSSLANARTALGVSGGSTSNNNFAALTNTANSLPYMTGSDAWSTTTLTSFARTLLDDGDASTMRATLGTVGITVSGTSSSGYAAFTSGGSNVFLIQWKDFTATADTTTSVTFPTSFSSYAKAWVNGANTDTDAQQNNVCVTSVTTSGATVTNAYGASSTACTIFAVGV